MREVIKSGSDRIEILSEEEKVLQFRELAEAIGFSRRFHGHPAAMSSIRQIVAARVNNIHNLNDHQVLARFSALLVSGDVRILQTRQDTTFIPAQEAAEAAAEVTAAAKAAEATHWIEFVFEYPDASPVTGRPYILLDPKENRTEGSLNRTGKIRQTDIPAGRYTVILKEIDSVSWVKPKIKADEEAMAYARTTGYPDGTAAKFRIFREFRETDADCLATLDVKISGGVAKAPWKYDYKKTKETREETGRARFVAELQIESSKEWAKTLEPLEIELKTIVSTRWSTLSAVPGQQLALEVETLGFGDGVEGVVEVWKASLFGDDKKIADVGKAKIKVGKLKTSWKCDSGSKEPEDFETYFRVKIDDGVSRIGLSNVLACSIQVAPAHWGKFLVVDDETGNPIEGVQLHITMPDGTEGIGTTSAAGLVEIRDVSDGQFSINFDIDGALLSQTFAFTGTGEQPAGNPAAPGGVK
jgi:hypothetical protein